ncbi:hypothetical protein SEA_VASUNZINGA_75 [Mycobacterium phage VasuNzinga]|uniref:DNA-binding phage zinc finger domain-containing protein n=1 Tax=Mycobacterium phage VasuNzinga TaxID=2301620 RepID=A0A385UL95_9CAUD|nr:hypothetical protein SEA_VASUNZINGA_75 [Mycobacterium phage VasuNzinga]
MPQVSEKAIELAKLVLAKCMSYDPYFPNASESQVRAWAEHIMLRNPDPEDMMNAVAVFYEHNTEGIKPLPASISTIAQQLRLNRTAHETREQRAVREARIDAKAEGRAVAELTQGSSERITLEEWERRHGTHINFSFGKEVPSGPNPLRTKCPWCRAPEGGRCVVPGTNQTLKRGFHDSRVALAEGRCAPGVGIHQSPHSEDCEEA